MLVALCSVLALTALFKLYRVVGGRARRWRRAAANPLAQVFRPDELQEFDAHLDEVAKQELSRLDAIVMHYVAGEAGHVVVISDWRHGIALGLSDGRQIALGGISRVERRMLVNRAARDKLRPAHVERDGFSYRLLLRGEAGAEFQIYTRRVALAP